MKVSCTVDYAEIEGEWGYYHGVRVTCSRCGRTEKAGGQHDRSEQRCLVQLRENCPRGESNFYEGEQ